MQAASAGRVVYFKSSSEQVQFSSNCFNMRICGSKAGKSLCRSYLETCNSRKDGRVWFFLWSVWFASVNWGCELQSWVEGCRIWRCEVLKFVGDNQQVNNVKLRCPGNGFETPRLVSSSSAKRTFEILSPSQIRRNSSISAHRRLRKTIIDLSRYVRMSVFLASITTINITIPISFVERLHHHSLFRRLERPPLTFLSI